MKGLGLLKRHLVAAVDFQRLAEIRVPRNSLPERALQNLSATDRLFPGTTLLSRQPPRLAQAADETALAPPSLIGHFGPLVLLNRSINYAATLPFLSAAIDFNVRFGLHR
jgi:hypothetical protein